MAITRRPVSKKKKPVPVPTATPTRKGVSQNRSLYPGSRGERDYPTLSNLKKPEGQSIWALRGIGRGDRSLVNQPTAKTVRKGVTAGVEAVGVTGGKVNEKIIGEIVRGVLSGLQAVKGIPAIQRGGILRPQTGASVKPRVAAKSRPASTWSEDRNPRPTRKPTSNQRIKRGVRSQ